MSSRALRRAQRELEEKQIQERLAQEEQNDDESEEEIAPKASAKPSLFAMLGGSGDDDDEDQDDPEDDVGVNPESQDKIEVANAPAKKSSKKSKKKKKKAKSKTATANPDIGAATQKKASTLDEIDQALLALNLSADGQSGDITGEQDVMSIEKQQLFKVLGIDNQHLHAANEMKKLFGRAALQATEEEARPRQRGGPQGGIAAAVAGRNAPGNRNLASLALRRNIFIQGKDEWPRATSGGLGMELVEKRADGSVEYRFVHNGIYQEVQRQFQICVGSMDPERMVQLLHHNPYHISTLLQVSEIAKQQRDNATASELLERALFTFGRSVHSTFSANLAAGKARLDFRRAENREFWLAVWRYIMTLGVRATWRTALEWARLLIAMDPEQDPYCLRLLIDQLALRGREPQAVIDLVEADYLQRLWKVPPNLAFSVALAHDRLKQPQQARSTLRNAIKEYPWLAARLCRELEISPIPKPIWGREPNGNYQELLCQMYVPKAKDLWNTTEGTSLLVEVCYSFEEELGTGEDPYWLAPIPETDLARHVILSDDQSLMALLDTRIKTKYTSVSDPLPPDDSINSYDVSAVGSDLPGHRPRANREDLLAELEEFRRYFEGFDIANLMGDEPNPEGIVNALREAGTSWAEYNRNLERFQLLRMRLQQEGVHIVFQEPDEGGRGVGTDSETDE
ncbi:hypothetical protein IAQ61_000170 [Plenodomus lingam]|uniref:Similar to Nulp1-pending protein n=1 Tax=Leptosphaeria maculans (strain JN3 / isolate v23.1.3 / race Av1-4-5-6-7-8) TaxID=985895 RepID=E5R4J5_LEPMJ|nr:similar to Nulp1-pending protein [Plenodomus lingam JN3]KAH9881445.1 hypothetical protein IAQ61_000170 [Plenodomus lingam]CBX91963.1 similar to Nulp1-pending protein [Plenodomus lingam JN3]